jgi:hypothetical protein
MCGLEDQENNLIQKLADTLIRKSTAESSKLAFEAKPAQIEARIDDLFEDIYNQVPEALAEVDVLNIQLRSLDEMIIKLQRDVEGKSRIIAGIQHTMDNVRKKGAGLTDFDQESLYQNSVNMTLIS